MTIALIAIAIVLFVVLIYVGHGYWAWVSAAALGLAAWRWAGVATPTAFWTVGAITLVLAAVFGFRPIRRLVLSGHLMGMMRGILPDTPRTSTFCPVSN